VPVAPRFRIAQDERVSPTTKKGIPWWARVAVGAAGTGLCLAISVHVEAWWQIVLLFGLYGLTAGLSTELGRRRPRVKVVLLIALAWLLTGVAPALARHTPRAPYAVSALFLGQCLALGIARSYATVFEDGEEKPADPLRTGGILLGLLATGMAGIALTLLGYLWTFGTPPDAWIRQTTLLLVWGTAACFGLVGATRVEPPTIYVPRRRQGPTGDTQDTEEPAEPARESRPPGARPE